MERNLSGSRAVLIQDLGLLLFMLCLLAGSLITGLSGRELIYQHTALLLGMTGAALLMVMRAKVAGTVLTGLGILAFAIFKLYNRIAYSVPIEWTAYVWPVLLAASLGGMAMFVSLYSTIEGINGILNRRLEELTVMDPVTGLENLRSLVNSLKRYMALSQRYGTGMGLMLIRLRYADEIRKVLTRNQFTDLRHLLAETVQRVLRMEDRVFTMDEAGSLGIIYFSQEAGAPVVKSRLQEAVKKTDMLPSVPGQSLNVEISVVFRQYNPEIMERDPLKFISEVEKEFAYEV